MKWIPMSERLPKNGHYYLWCSDMGSVQSDYYWDGFEKEQKYGYNIVAWMPLPRPYTADLKTEPQLTPNYCGTCRHRDVPCGDLPCDVCHSYSNYEPQDEPTISILEQVDEPQNGYQTFNGTSVYVSRLEEEPKTERSKQ